MLGSYPHPGMVLGTRWNSSLARLVAGLAALATAAALATTPARAEPEGRVSVIVRELPAAGDLPERTVEGLGGTVGPHIGLIDGFVAEVDASDVGRLRGAEGVLSVTPDLPVRPLKREKGSEEGDPGSMAHVNRVVGARDAWEAGYTGEGVDIAVIDTGVVPVEGLTAPDKVVNGPDLSFESQIPDLRYLDAYGHGTHVVGIIAGRDEAGLPTKREPDRFAGVAPGARIVSVKVADAGGVTDVSQVLAAIDWVVQHRSEDGLNIRVLNLSFGTDGVQDYRLDPLTYAVEVAWRKGIVVVTAAGNEGFGSAKLNNPAYDPFVLAVGAADTRGTVRGGDDVVPDWSSRGDGNRNPDVVAPGKSIVSLRNPGSLVDDLHPEGYVSERFFRGSGTSQAAAVVTGAAAILLEQRPDLTPDQVKALLTSTASELPKADPAAQGSGMIDLEAALAAAAPSPSAAAQPFAPALGTGSLDAARGTMRVAGEDGVVLEGEQDIFGTPWDGKTWSELAWESKTWSGGEWLGKTWSGKTWSGSSWAGKTWSDAIWDGKTWSGKTWSSENWSGKTWSGKTWSGESWSGKTWSGKTWSGKTWSDVTWSGKTWSSAAWS